MADMAKAGLNQRSCVFDSCAHMMSVQAEAQLGLQTRILSERCMELQAKMDRSKVSQYDLFGQLEQLRAQNAEQHQQLTDALCESKQRHEENRTAIARFFVAR